MSFAWPWLLLTLLALPLCVVWYRRQVRRRERRRAELAALGLVARTGGVAGGRRRAGRLPAALYLASLAVLCLAVARPQATLADPRREGTVVLAFDASASMGATDLVPTRLEAAKAAARGFVARQPEQVRLGVVAFAESGVITQQPTTDRAKVLATIDRMTPQGGTALGRGIQTALGAIVGRTVLVDQTDRGVEASGQDLGYRSSAAVILLSDGENTTAPDPLELARIAATAGVKVFPIGLGSAGGSVLSIDGFQVATALDEPLLRQIADTTDGEYFAAADERELARVYDSIDLTWTAPPRPLETTGGFAALALLMVLLAAAVSLRRTGRVI